jgi:hypothetical protein
MKTGRLLNLNGKKAQINLINCPRLFYLPFLPTGLRPNLSFSGFQVNKSKSIEDEKLLTGRC